MIYNDCYYDYFNKNPLFADENHDIGVNNSLYEKYYEYCENQNDLEKSINEDNKKKDNNNNYKEFDDKVTTIIKSHQEKENIDVSNNKKYEKEKINNNEIPKKKQLGRKRKLSKEDGNHNKYCEDNIIRKVKSKIVVTLSNFINNLLIKLYNNNMGKGTLKKELLKMNQNQITNLTNDKEFIYKKIKDILSNTISTKYTCYRPEHNKVLIEELLNENDIEKRQLFENIFSLSFLDILKHIKGEINIKELDGIDSLEKICEKFQDDDDYIQLFKYYIDNFESIIMNKRNRKPRNKRIMMSE